MMMMRTMMRTMRRTAMRKMMRMMIRAMVGVLMLIMMERKRRVYKIYTSNPNICILDAIAE